MKKRHWFILMLCFGSIVACKSGDKEEANDPKGFIEVKYNKEKLSKEAQKEVDRVLNETEQQVDELEKEVQQSVDEIKARAAELDKALKEMDEEFENSEK
eukprot:gnl/MRDRNA2_/MRDRNA2_56594_c0_seq1.p1 gnl/MRDRNA2_/MRDRNA2_56594_c0~~gnl/MRDRNA2_/MRDRNA2_56594_c0_seq1.p1  ORF type:complete len:100 (+),score=19.77 gnl/MRDRNA2_/MRDRNA2_56594_c0_seq1:63-362(+)